MATLSRPPRGDAGPSARRPRVLLAPDKFKGTATAAEAAAALARGIRGAAPGASTIERPLADGGEGTLEALMPALGLRRRVSRVSGPLGAPIDATWGWNPAARVAVVELAAAAGLGLVPRSRRTPERTTTHGVGECIAEALRIGAVRVIVGLGGSATCDAGAGLAQALGARFLDQSGATLPAPLLGAELTRIGRVDLRESLPALAQARIEGAVDVDNPLLGERGAARVFAPQKGADEATVARLEAGLAVAATAPVEGRCVRELAALPGAGAAGGAGFGLAAWCGATLRPGADLVLDAVDFDAAARGCDLVVVGEGRLDASSVGGKAAVSAARRAAALGVRVVVVAGEIARDEAAAELSALFAERLSLVEAFGAEAARQRPVECLEAAGRAIAGWL